MNTFTLKTIYWNLPSFVRSIINECEIALWALKNKPVPAPHFVKQVIIQDFQKKYLLDTLIETGTYFGDMLYAQANVFKTLYSIELDHTLFSQAQNRFNNFSHIHIYEGDSSSLLPIIIKKLTRSSLFWLDGHYSGGLTAKGKKECPIFAELRSIAQSKYDHIILIDDARCFTGAHDYPTIDELKKTIATMYKNASISVTNDVIRVVPKSLQQ